MSSQVKSSSNKVLQVTILFATLTLSASSNRSDCLRLTATSHYCWDFVDVGCPVVLLTVL